MHSLRSILTCLTIASLLVSDVVVAVHSARCSHGVMTAESASSSDGEQANEAKRCCCSHHCGRASSVDAQGSDYSLPGGQRDGGSEHEHDSDQCTICRGALICRFAVLVQAVLPPAFDELEDSVASSVVTVSPSREFSSALSERGPPA